VSVFFPGRVPPSEGLIRLAPDIAVEVVSPRPRDGKRDRVDKLAEYAAFGVKSYWLVDPKLRTLEVFALGRGHRYVHVVGASAGVIKKVAGCTGLVVDLDALWAEVDRLAKKAPAKPRRSPKKTARRR
jgi:Uma2 family endonuclease